MTNLAFEQAMASVAEDIYVRRSSWSPDRVLHREETWVDEECPDGWMIADHILHPAGGSWFGTYHPTPEDEAATDWESHFQYF